VAGVASFNRPGLRAREPTEPTCAPLTRAWQTDTCIRQHREYTGGVPSDPQHRTCLSADEVLSRPPVNTFPIGGAPLPSKQGKLIAVQAIVLACVTLS
jgi:hypothetical protein